MDRERLVRRKDDREKGWQGERMIGRKDGRKKGWKGERV